VVSGVFTGLVQGLGSVLDARATAEGTRLTIASDVLFGIEEGHSVAVNGVCLTAVDPRDGVFSADVMGETLRRSNLELLASGMEVNLELPLRPQDRLGGHFVQGHVDGVGVVEAAEDDGFARVLRIGAPPELLRYVVEKGSIAVDGVSLTVAAVDDEAITVSLIPETLERTTLGSAEPGRSVNLEVDVLAKYVEKLVAAR
jgi:riboflavin synthase